MIIRVTVMNNLTRNTVMTDSAKTIRQFLEENNVDYARGKLNIDGVMLTLGDFDKTFDDFGITQSCYVNNVVKADNAAAIQIHGGACVIESAMKLADLKKIAKYRPEALTLYKGEGRDKEPEFTISNMFAGTGNIGTFGACFGTQATESGNATIVMVVPDNVTDAKEWAKDTIGVAILKLNELESTLNVTMNLIDDEIDAIESNITVM